MPLVRLVSMKMPVKTNISLSPKSCDTIDFAVQNGLLGAVLWSTHSPTSLSLTLSEKNIKANTYYQFSPECSLYQTRDPSTPPTHQSTHTLAHTHAHTHTHKHTNARTPTHARTRTHAHTHTYTHTVNMRQVSIHNQKAYR